MARVVKVTLPKVKCNSCGYVWSPRKELVTQCPRCQGRDIQGIQSGRVQNFSAREVRKFVLDKVLEE